MEYAIVIPDGCADEPQTSLGGKTPLQAARKQYRVPAVATELTFQLTRTDRRDRAERAQAK